MSLIPASLRSFNWAIIALVVALVGFGLVVLYSASGGHLKPWAMSQGIRFVVFLIFALGLSRIPESLWKAGAFPAFAGVLLLLVAVELLGAVGGGSRRWLDLGIIRLQPSELMKLTIVLAVARFYDLLPAGEIRGVNALWPPAVMIGLPFLLVLTQPDLGTATMIAAGGIVVVFLAGIPLRLFAGAAGSFALILPIVWSQMHDYQRNRVLVFLNPESNPLGTGYHITQSKIAIGSGGVFGKGYLNGTQSHLDYLPEGHTDFVFATMAEEWGLVGGVAIIIGFLLLCRWGLRVAARAPTRFGRLAAAGLTTTIFFYVAINLMMVMGLAPVVGIPLPLISFGGTAMLTVLMCIGILMSIERDGNRQHTGFS
ncbi:rod shape-determining protein RodA [Sphingomonas sp.]|uniref:rod shape-determining protein RodA n=1 Tax=Sphingomonas sp. TaxID=28214 RepID=UPI0025EC333F|nr:rod shape-determining protein RodA [Sphingomonas sp.]